MPTSIAILSKLLFIAMLVAGCRTPSSALGAHDGCIVDPSVWREVPIPLEREALLDLPEQTSKTPVRRLFLAADGLREVWFESSNKDLQVCLYDPRRACRHGGTLRRVIFTKGETSWEAGRTEQIFCSD